ncbi:MAG: biphenyl 2,3-dioxygenase [Sphingopyxis macrogoltabida]|uniref:Biphenyl 2,3-dioxygenase n=1 Tax=Sphingopyxis macrogoltabida TaxID=33050 RepID=A0A2W5NE62_SPHMC|nr:MAG: biphenyl 2,3-dioxygenase [Sphingopyxis macrogoltabida]
MATSSPIKNRAIRPAKLAHAVLRVASEARYREMIAWYQTVLDARIVFESPAMSFLTYDEEHHRIAIAWGPHVVARAPHASGLDHLAFTYDSLDDLLATHDRLRALGIEPFCPVNHGPTTSLYYRDPDGNRIELQIDNFADMDDATAHMRAVYDVNMVGELFDPDDLAARRAEGEAAGTIVRPSPDDITPPQPQLIEKLLAE